MPLGIMKHQTHGECSAALGRFVVLPVVQGVDARHAHEGRGIVRIQLQSLFECLPGFVGLSPMRRLQFAQLQKKRNL